jgi:hypothetical protein
MTPQRLREIAESIEDRSVCRPEANELRAHADQLERNGECRQFYVKDHPEVNGRTAVKGEHGYTLRFPLQDGTELQVLCGEETLTRFSDMIGRMLIDNDAEAK